MDEGRVGGCIAAMMCCWNHPKQRCVIAHSACEGVYGKVGGQWHGAGGSRARPVHPSCVTVQGPKEKEAMLLQQ